MFELFSQYTWGQFGLFLLALLVIYYAIVGFVYYRHGFGGKGLTLSRPAKGDSTTSAAPNALVRTASAFPKTATVPASSATDSTTDEEEEEQETEQAVIINGSLPESTAITQQQLTLGEESDEQLQQKPSADEDDEDDEGEADELDQVDAALLETLRQLGVAPPVNDENADNENADEADSLNQDDTSMVETAAAASAQSLLPEYSFEPISEPVASTLDILPVEEQLYTAESVADFIAQIKSGEKPAIPSELLETSLVAQMAGLMDEANQEMSALFD